MDEKKAFEQINILLADTDYPITVTSIADVEEFLLDDSNRRFSQYATLGRIYDSLKERAT